MRRRGCAGTVFAPYWFRIAVSLEPGMPLGLSIKNAPDEMVRRLKERAEARRMSFELITLDRQLAAASAGDRLA